MNACFTVPAPGLYIHVPFCERACPYCDFDFQVGRGERLTGSVEQWLAGLERERHQRAASLATLPSFDTLYLGGGTPSVLDPTQLRAVFAWLRSSLIPDPSSLRELSVELNPEHVDDARLDVLAASGVGRVSLGIQTLSPVGLRELGRVHDRAAALAAIERCSVRGLRISADLIVGWRGQGPTELIRDIDELVDAGVEHVSIYGLTIEPGTSWPKLVRRGLRVLPDEDVQTDLLVLAEDQLVARGFDHYEVASYARPGAEAIHNSKYWQWIDIIGLGPSAASVSHGREGHHRGAQTIVERRSNARGLGSWATSGATFGAAGAQPTIERLEGSRAASEGLWLGLRRLRGLTVEAFLARFGVDRAWLEARVARQVALGNLEWLADNRVLRVAPGRWLWHDSIAIDLL